MKLSLIAFLPLFTLVYLQGDEKTPPKAFLDGISGPGWVTLGEKDFAQVNCDPETFQFKDDGTMHCTGKPSGGLRSQKVYKNFEMVLEWKHLRYAGNAGIFIWCPRAVLDKLPRGKLPQGIEIQISSDLVINPSQLIKKICFQIYLTIRNRNNIGRNICCNITLLCLNYR